LIIEFYIDTRVDLCSYIDPDVARDNKAPSYLSELRRDFLASIGITYAVF